MLVSLIVMLVVMTGCVASKDIIENGRVTKSIHARISDMNGNIEEVEVDHYYSFGSIGVTIYTTDNRKISTSFVNVILTEKLE